MSKLILPPPCFYFLSVIYRSDLLSKLVINDLLKPLGMVNSMTFFFPITQPSLRLLNYYKKEMGEPLQRLIFASNMLCSRDIFADLKVKATSLEDEYSYNKKRAVNLDVGQINLENLQLASGKMYSHRVYLRDGVYSDLHYQFKNSTFESLPWCYPDYAQVEVIEFFNHLRAILLQSIDT